MLINLFEAAAKGLMPDPVLTVSSWADSYRMLSSKDSSEPGRYRTSRTPYLQDIMDDLSNESATERVVFLAGAQVGKSVCGLNWIGYVIDVAPGPMLCVQPTVDIAKRFSKQRLDPMIEETAPLRAKISAPKSRDADNTQMSKGFPGGLIMLAGANSASGLRSMPIRYLFCDEIDAYPSDLDDEGSPLALAEKRTTTFTRRKIFLCSTPTIKDASLIEAEFKRGDQRYYNVPCPHCNEHQPLVWKNLKWEEGKPETARYACQHCGTLIEERYKTNMLTQGKWVATAKGDGKTHSYHLNSLYSPLGWKSWADIVREFLSAKDDPAALKTWVNTVLGETWEENYSAVLDPLNLMGRAMPFDIDAVPTQVLAITMGVDVQDDRLAVSIYGWGATEDVFVLYHQEISGDPSAPQLWDELDALRMRQFKRTDGKRLQVLMCAVDSGGHYTQTVYDYCRQRRGDVIAIKGQSQSGKPIISKPSKVDFKANGRIIKNGVELYPVGTDTAKTTIYQRLRKTEGYGVWHFSKTLSAEFYNQLTAEKQIIKYVQGMPKRQWVKKDSARNEALDTAVYAYAALNWLYFKYSKATIWKTLADKLTNQAIEEDVEQVVSEVAHQVPAQQIVQQAAAPVIRRKSSSFW